MAEDITYTASYTITYITCFIVGCAMLILYIKFIIKYYKWKQKISKTVLRFAMTAMISYILSCISLGTYCYFQLEFGSDKDLYETPNIIQVTKYILHIRIHSQIL